jgi:hypothetical protein
MEASFGAAVVADGGAIVGALLMSLRPLRAQGRSMLGRGGGDAAVATSYQGKGILSAIQSFLLKADLPTADLSYGYRTGHVAALKAFSREKRGVFGNHLNVLIASAWPAPFEGVPDEPWELLAVSEFDDRIDALWEEAAAQFDFILARTRDFLNWRYCDLRGGTFRVVLAEQDGRILGYAVERCSHGKGYIADLFALPGRLDVVSSLVRTALADIREAGIDEVECWLASRHEYFNTLAAAGFSAIKTTKDLTYRPLRAAEQELSFLRDPQSKVHFMAGDTDLV